MFKPQLLRQVARAARAHTPRASFQATRPVAPSLRQFSNSVSRFDRDGDKDAGDYDTASTAGQPGESGEHEGQYARTDDSVRVEYPEEDDLPPSQPVQGRGGVHFKRTLASFSLEGRVGVVTGGARGLGLVMAQALVSSGANVAIVDMNREEATRSAEGLMEVYREENPGAKEYARVVSWLY